MNIVVVTYKYLEENEGNKKKCEGIKNIERSSVCRQRPLNNNI